MADITDKLRKTHGGASSTLTSGIDSSTTSFALSSTAGWARDTALDIVIDRIDADGNLTPLKQEVITAVVDDSGVTNCVRGVTGTAQVHAAGAVVEASVNSSAARNDEIDAVLAEHNQNGTHKMTSSFTNKIKEALAGLTSWITGSMIVDSSIQPSKVTSDFWDGHGGGVDYSLDEQDTGRKWIDGKTIYQKTIQITDFTTKNINHNISGIYSIIDYDSILMISSQGQYRKPNRTGSTYIIVDVSNTQILLANSGSAITGNLYVTIFYTKTS